MQKLKMHSPDMTQDHIARIRELFPNCVTEAQNADGSLRLSVDFDALRQELSDSIVEGPQERYQLDWPGKRKAMLAANASIAKALRPCREEGVDFDTTQNLFIEGDNLDALKLLQETYLGKVKMIYIDPPYNTGNDFIYEDDFAETAEEYLSRSNQKDEEGNRLVANTESNGRFHSDWLSMMYPRLKIARNLLSNDGVIFISCDENESYNIISVCSEIFGRENFIAQICIKVNPRGRHLDRFIAKTHEYILIYTKNKMNTSSLSGLNKEGKMLEEYDHEDEKGKFRLLGLRNRNQSFNPETRPNLYYPIFVDPIKKEISLEKDNIFTVSVYPDAPDGTKTCWTWGKDKVVQEKELLCAEQAEDGWRIFRKDYLLAEDGLVAKTLAKSIWDDKSFSNDYGRASIKNFFSAPIMSFPKSPDLIKQLLKIGTKNNSIILDFFAGSSTTAHAVMQLNAEDGGNRRFIMVQLPEPCDAKSEAAKAGYSTIAEISKERIRRAGKKILEGDCHEDWNRDVGFRVLKVDSSNMADVFYTPDALRQDLLHMATDNVKPDRSPEDLLFQVLLDWGVELTLPIRKESIQGKTVFFVDENALVACFDRGIDEALVKELTACQPLRVVFRDNGFVSDAVKINVEQIFHQLSPTTEVRCL
ncbi:site-specific DNA-methyltransferase [Desulfovibrio piger]|nr:site-specific DNA-methyltransferase [Desulfovibrio piger]